jgi:hypothetical protein
LDRSNLFNLIYLSKGLLELGSPSTQWQNLSNSIEAANSFISYQSSNYRSNYNASEYMPRTEQPTCNFHNGISSADVLSSEETAAILRDKPITYKQRMRSNSRLICTNCYIQHYHGDTQSEKFFCDLGSKWLELDVFIIDTISGSPNKLNRMTSVEEGSKSWRSLTRGSSVLSRFRNLGWLTIAA